MERRYLDEATQLMAGLSVARCSRGGALGAIGNLGGLYCCWLLRLAAATRGLLPPHQAGIVLRRRRLVDLPLEMMQRGGVGKSRLPQQRQVAFDREAARLVVPGCALWLDEIAVHQDAALGQRLAAAAIDVGDGLLAAKVVQRPGGDDGVRRAGQVGRPGWVCQVRLGQRHPRPQIAQGARGDVEENRGEIQALIANGAVAFQYVAGHIARPDAKFQDVGLGDAKLADLVQDHVEQRQPRRGGDEAVGPSLHEGGVVEFVLGADKAGHRRLAFP